MRTKAEIAVRWNEKKDSKICVFGTGELMSYLDYETIKNHCSPPLLPEEYGLDNKALDPEEARKRLLVWAVDIKSFIDAGKTKITSRMFHRFAAMLWIDGDDSICSKIEAKESFTYDDLLEIYSYLGIDPKGTD